MGLLPCTGGHLRILILFAALLPCLATAQGWATFRNCGPATEPRPAQQISGGCQPAELPEDLESGDPSLACRSDISPGKADLLVRVYVAASRQYRAYIYANEGYQRSIISFIPLECYGDGQQLIDIGTYTYSREQQRHDVLELHCAGGEVDFFRIRR